MMRRMKLGQGRSSWALSWIAAGVLGSACSDDGTAAGATDGQDTETDGGGETSASASATASDTADPSVGSQGQTSGEATTGDSTTGNDSTSGSSAGESTGGPSGSNGCCEAHASPGCNEPEVQLCVCEAQASCCVFEWDEICVQLAQNDCAATCMGVGESSGGTETTGNSGMACDDTVTVELGAEEAELSGDWALQTSQVGEGMIAALDPPAVDGAVTWSVDIPCEDTWFIWVRYWEQGQYDSYYATLDGEPDPPAVFEGDCTQQGQGYGWTVLNRREEGGQPCVYDEDPWTADWGAGTHEVAFSYRESIAIARIVVTNDPDYNP